jgi:hypothetical protein
MSGTKSKSKLSIVDPLETGRELVRSVGKPSSKWLADEASQSSKTFLEQLLGLNLTSKKEPIKADQQKEETSKTDTTVVEVFNHLLHRQSAGEQSKNHSEKKVHPRAEAAIDYHRDIVKSRERASKGDLREVQRSIEEIKVELSKLVATSQVLKLEFAEVSVEQSNQNVGQYHLTFFEWMIAVIRSARQKVEDSGAWLNTIKGKGNKKSYWGMFKKHGTTFGLSGERAVATQVG